MAGIQHVIQAKTKNITAAEFAALDGAAAKLSDVGAVIASGTQADNLADLGTSASGTEIAAAVNALRDALVAFKIMKAGS